MPLEVYDETIRVLKSAVGKAKLGHDEELGAIRGSTTRRAAGAARHGPVGRAADRRGAAAIRSLSAAAACSAGSRLRATAMQAPEERVGHRLDFAARFGLWSSLTGAIDATRDWTGDRGRPGRGGIQRRT